MHKIYNFQWDFKTVPDHSCHGRGKMVLFERSY